MSHDPLIRFEEDNFYDLAEKFIKEKGVRDIWDEFVVNEYEIHCSCNEPDLYEEGR